MVPRRGRSVVSTFSHTMILYQNERQLHQLLTPYVSDAVKPGDVCSILTSHPTQDRKFLSRIMKRRGIRGKAGSFVHDAKKLFVESPDPVASFVELWDKMEKEYEPERHRWTNIGSFLHEFYPRFGVVLDIEHLLRRRRPPAAVLCCYWNEGFSSLDPKDILELFALHDRVHFRTAVF